MARDVLVAGETLIDFVPSSEGPLESVEGFDRRPGGAPANVAVGLARLGRQPLFWTRVGEDSFGRYLRDVLDENGVSDRFAEADPDAKTTLAFVTHDDAGDRTFTFYRDGTADTRLRPGAVPDGVLADVGWVHAGGVALSSGRAREATLDLLERAAALDCTVSFDPNLRAELWDDASTCRRVVLEALAHVDLCILSGDELASLGVTGESGDDPPDDPVLESATDLLRADLWAEFDGDGPQAAVVTRGSDGAVAVGSDRSPWPGTADHEGYDPAVVDTTGAGDAFVAGLVDSLLGGMAMADALSVANAVGATATTATGGMAAIPTADEIRSFRSEAVTDPE